MIAELLIGSLCVISNVLDVAVQHTSKNNHGLVNTIFTDTMLQGIRGARQYNHLRHCEATSAAVVIQKCVSLDHFAFVRDDESGVASNRSNTAVSLTLKFEGPT